MVTEVTKRRAGQGNPEQFFQWASWSRKGWPPAAPAVPVTLDHVSGEPARRRHRGRSDPLSLTRIVAASGEILEESCTGPPFLSPRVRSTATSVPTMWWAVRNGMPLVTRYSASDVASRKPRSSVGSIRSLS